jgi:hypothetical protein
MNLYSLSHYLRFYQQAVTKYQLHSPAVFAMVMDVLEDTRRYYAFEDIPALRRELLRKLDSSGDSGQQKIRDSILLNAPARRMGERLFRLVRHFAPDRIIMLGTGASLGCLYAAAACPSALELWEGQKAFEPQTRHNLEFGGYKHQTWVQHGKEVPFPEFSEKDLVVCFSDFDFKDPEELKRFFSQAPRAWVLMDMYRSPERFHLLNSCRQFPIVRASVDFFDFTVLFPDMGMRAVQHLKVVTGWQKLWKFY